MALSVNVNERPTQPKGRGCIILLTLAGGLSLLACLFALSMLHEAMFIRKVKLERQGWAFEAKYEVGFGVTTKYSRLSFLGKDVGQSLPRPITLLTPIGEFVSSDSGWVAAWSDPQVWDEKYRLPELNDGQPWVPQSGKSAADAEFISRGFYRAPKDARSSETPWTNLQLKGTPANWVYVYRVTHSPNTESSNPVVDGYWVDPSCLANLTWD